MRIRLDRSTRKKFQAVPEDRTPLPATGKVGTVSATAVVVEVKRGEEEEEEKDKLYD